MFLIFPPDVCAPVCGRESGPTRSDLEAAEGEDPSHHRLLHAAVPGVRLPSQEEDPDVPQVLPEDKADQGAGRIGFRKFGFKPRPSIPGINSFLSLQSRQPPPHLTSAQSEQLLARACENESANAKRMREGLEPVSQPLPILATTSTLNPPCGIDVLAGSAAAIAAGQTATVYSGEKQLKTEYKSEQLASLLAATANQQQQQQQLAALVPASSGESQLAKTTLSAAGFTTFNGAAAAAAGTIPVSLCNGLATVGGAQIPPPANMATLFRPAFPANATPVSFANTQALLQQQTPTPLCEYFFVQNIASQSSLIVDMSRWKYQFLCHH